jgi:histidinol-phosphate aminotransferase
MLPRPRAAVLALAEAELSPSRAPIELALDRAEGPALTEHPKETPGLESLRKTPGLEALTAALAKRHGVSKDQVLVTAGVDEAIDRAFRAYLEPGRKVLVTEPCYDWIQRSAALSGATLAPVPWALDGVFPKAGLVKSVSADVAVIALVAPNNFSGALISARDLTAIVEAAPHALLLLDFAGLDFVAESWRREVLQELKRWPNALALFSLSKAWGLAGLRIGYALAQAPIIDLLRRAGPRPTVSGSSLKLAEELLSSPRSEDLVQNLIQELAVERRELSRALTRWGVEVFPSQANLVLARFAEAEFVQDALAGLGIAVRRFIGSRDLEGCLRITCPGHAKSFARLLHALETVLAPEALILDLDGVLADVSQSYRRCILETARRFGQELQEKDVKAAKAKGNANNDWVLTTRMLQEAGCKVQFEEVKAVFQEIYHGAADKPGLRQRETLIGSAAIVHELASSLPLAIVTGRPRADAERFLMSQRLLDSFITLVCLEDAPSKPDPAPVQLALKRLGVSRAWMIGDTPDDIRAARAAGVVPFGVLAPGDSRELAGESMLDAGATRVLKSLHEIMDYLP